MPRGSVDPAPGIPGCHLPLLPPSHRAWRILFPVPQPLPWVNASSAQRGCWALDLQSLLPPLPTALSRRSQAVSQQTVVSRKQVPACGKEEDSASFLTLCPHTALDQGLWLHLQGQEAFPTRRLELAALGSQGLPRLHVAPSLPSFHSGPPHPPSRATLSKIARPFARLLPHPQPQCTFPFLFLLKI